LRRRGRDERLRDGAELAYRWHVEQMRRISVQAVAEITPI
jgi:hypothetical protein